jgi:hypothetical protein
VMCRSYKGFQIPHQLSQFVDCHNQATNHVVRFVSEVRLLPSSCMVEGYTESRPITAHVFSIEITPSAASLMEHDSSYYFSGAQRPEIQESSRLLYSETRLVPRPPHLI